MKQLIFHPLVVIVFTIVSIVITFSLYSNAKEINSSTSTIKVLEDQVDVEKEKVDNLKIKLEQASQDFTQEKIVRDELLLQKPGEYIVQISKDNNHTQTDKQKTEHSKTDKPAWQEWWEMVF